MLTKNKAKHLQTGATAELQALNYLQQQGLRHLDSNYRCKMGELDLIMQHGKILVIVEVRYRKSNQYGGALASITSQKQQRIIAAAQHYVIIKQFTHLPLRFDVVALSGGNTLQWIKDAFRT